MELQEAIHIARNPFGYDDYAVREARLTVCTEVERLTALLKEAPKFFTPQYDFEGEKLDWLNRAGLA